MAERMAASLWVPDKRYPNGCGVYVIRCVANGRMYIGSSTDLATRLSKHFTSLRGGRHENKKLQNHFNKYGEVAFVCDLLESVDCKADLDKAEQRWIDRYWPTKRLLNTQRVAGRPPSFYELSPDVRERKRVAHAMSSTGRQPSQKLLAVLSARTGRNNPNFGTTWPEARRAQMSDRMSGNKNPSYGVRGELSPSFGVVRSDETRALMSKNNHWNRTPPGEHPSSRRCRRVLPDGSASEWGSAREAARALGLGLSTVGRYCNGERQPADGSVWSYA